MHRHALAIDACNSVMDKIDHAADLHLYATRRLQASTWLATNNGTAPIDPARVYKAPNSFSDKFPTCRGRRCCVRCMFYFAVWALIGGARHLLSARQRISINVLHDRTPQYVLVGRIDHNGYDQLLNMIPTPRTFAFPLRPAGATLTDARRTADTNSIHDVPGGAGPSEHCVSSSPCHADALPIIARTMKSKCVTQTVQNMHVTKATFMAPEGR